MPSLKQAAADAVGKLAKYLKRDALGTTMLIAVKQYLISLRQINGALREKTATAAACATAAAAEVLPLTNEVIALKAKVSALEGANAQLRSDKARLAREKEMLNDPEAVEPCDPTDFFDEAGFAVLAAQLKRRMSCPPTRQSFAKEHDVAMVRLVDIVRGYTAPDDYTTLGMFVAIMAISGMPVAAYIHGSAAKVAGIVPTRPAISRRYSFWLRPWLNDLPNSNLAKIEPYQRGDTDHAES